MAARPPGRTAHLGQAQAPRLQRRSGAIPTGISSHSLPLAGGCRGRLPQMPSPTCPPLLAALQGWAGREGILQASSPPHPRESHRNITPGLPWQHSG